MSKHTDSPAAGRPGFPKGLNKEQLATDAQMAAMNFEPWRLAYRVDEVAALTGLSRKTIYRRIADGTLVSTTALGRRLVEAKSVRALFERE
jgi:excisionase family DNA binding protein